METPADKRNRLRRDLQKAYGEWMIASESAGAPERGDDAGRRDAVQAKWSAYLAAKARLAAERAAAS